MDRVTIHDLHKKKQQSEPITVLTAYDYPTALILDQSGVDMILVGDSLGMVVHGFETTLPVTMDMMIMHCQAVRRGTKRALMVADMPFMSYQTTIADAKRNAGRLLTEGGADAVKLEGGQHMVKTVRALVEIGIAVQGHLGLTPQSVSAFGGFKTQAKSVAAARQLIQDAKDLEAAGAFSIVLEAIPAKLAALVSRFVSVPTIGIGAGHGCDGQVLVLHDMLGLFDRFTPKFVKRYASLAADIQEAVKAYMEEVRNRDFPASEHAFTISDAVWDSIVAEFNKKDK